MNQKLLGAMGALADRMEGEVSAGMRRRQSETVMLEATNLMAIGRVDQGRAGFERAVAIDPTNDRAWLMLAEAARMVQDWAGAEKAVAHAYASADSETAGDAAFVSGMLRFTRADTLGALREFSRSQSLHPGSPRAWLTEARIRAVRGDLTGARDVLRRGLLAVPGDPELIALQGKLGG